MIIVHYPTFKCNQASLLYSSVDDEQNRSTRRLGESVGNVDGTLMHDLYFYRMQSPKTSALRVAATLRPLVVDLMKKFEDWMLEKAFAKVALVLEKDPAAEGQTVLRKSKGTHGTLLV